MAGDARRPERQSGARRSPAYPRRRSPGLLYPVSADLLATTGRPVDLFGFEPNPARLGAAAAASASVPGIALAQLGALLDAASLGYNPAVAKPLAVLGHSQGVLAVHMVQAIVEAGSIEAASAQIDEILAIATLIGVAGTRQARQLGLNRTSRRSHADAVCQGTSPAPRWRRWSRVNNARGPIAVAVTNPPRIMCSPATRRTWPLSPSKSSADTSTRPSCAKRRCGRSRVRTGARIP